MDYTVYKLIHYVGIFLLMLSLGSLFTKYNKCAVIGHGVALLMILVAGFGMHAKHKDKYVSMFETGFPTWMIFKLVIWVLFGAMIVLIKRGVLKGQAAWGVALLLGVTAAYFALRLSGAII